MGSDVSNRRGDLAAIGRGLSRVSPGSFPRTAKGELAQVLLGAAMCSPPPPPGRLGKRTECVLCNRGMALLGDCRTLDKARAVAVSFGLESSCKGRGRLNSVLFLQL